MKRLLFFLCGLLLLSAAQAQQIHKTEHVFLITIDGLRWQEFFSGADEKLIKDKRYSPDQDLVVPQFWHEDPQERRKALMPFVWSILASEGRLLGNRHYKNKVNLTTNHHFSYPGYNEILTGYGDPKVKKNAPINNENVTILEWVNQQPGFEGKVALFGSWHIFPYIVNEERSGIPVNAGYEPAKGPGLTEREKLLNKLQEEIPGHWRGVRQDAFTHHYALEYIKKHQPRLLHIAYGEVDDFAHDGRYDAYLTAARQNDNFIRELWTYVQSNDYYKDKTTFIITTDHGRGKRSRKAWKKHGRGIKGSDEVWVAMIGPDTGPAGELKTKAQFYQNQIAPTIAYFLGLQFTPHKEQDDGAVTLGKQP
jgi:hypothetical protein